MCVYKASLYGTKNEISIYYKKYMAFLIGLWVSQLTRIVHWNGCKHAFLVLLSLN